MPNPKRAPRNGVCVDHPAMIELRRANALRALLSVLLVFSLCLAPRNVLAADHTDVVVMANGDRMVGEIKGLEFGHLQFKASYMASSVDLDWTKIKGLETIRRFRVEFADGQFLAGTIRKLESATPNGDFEVTSEEGTTTRNFIGVVGLEPLESSIWARFRGSADVGLTLHPQAELTQWTANANIRYPSENYLVDSQASSLFSAQ